MDATHLKELPLDLIGQVDGTDEVDGADQVDNGEEVECVGEVGGGGVERNSLDIPPTFLNYKNSLARKSSVKRTGLS